MFLCVLCGLKSSADFIRDPERFLAVSQCVCGAERLRRAKTPANQRGGRAFHVQEIFGCFRRKAFTN